jgi:hypothetical protein
MYSSRDSAYGGLRILSEVDGNADMAKLTDEGRVISDDREWQWNSEGGSIGGGSWERIVPMTKKPGLATRLMVKKSAWGKPGLAESRQADKFQQSRANRKLVEVGQRLEADVERRKAER